MATELCCALDPPRQALGLRMAYRVPYPNQILNPFSFLILPYNPYSLFLRISFGVLKEYKAGKFLNHFETTNLMLCHFAALLIFVLGAVAGTQLCCAVGSAAPGLWPAHGVQSP